MLLLSLPLALAAPPMVGDEPEPGTPPLAPELQDYFAGEQRARRATPPIGPFALGSVGVFVGAGLATCLYPIGGTCVGAGVSAVGVPLYYWNNDPTLPQDVALESPDFILGYTEQMRRRRTRMAGLGSALGVGVAVGASVALFCVTVGTCEVDF